jgi:hypothetical protein
MKRLNLIYTGFFAITSFFAAAQVNQTPMTGGGRQILMPGPKTEAATGTMFTTDSFLPAKLSNNDKTILVKYNAYSDYFEMNDPQAQNSKSLPKQKDVTITFVNNGEVYLVEDYKTEKGELINGYLNIVSDNAKVKIFKRERIYLQPGSSSVNSYQTSKPASYKKAEDEFYVQLNGGEIVYFSGKKDIANLIPGKSKEILEFIKKNKISMDEEADLQQLSGYLETIL